MGSSGFASAAVACLALQGAILGVAAKRAEQIAAKRAEQIAAKRADVVSTIVFPVADMAAATAFYAALGLQVQPYDEGYCWLLLDGHEVLHLSLQPDMDVAGNRAAGYWHVRDVDAVHRAWADAGVDVPEPVDQPWGMREMEVTDPSGNRLRIGRHR